MGADGGVVYIPLREASDASYSRVVELLQPLWQFLSDNCGGNVGEDANWEWIQNNSIDPPNYILGYYGTDRGDALELGDLRELCDPDSKDPYYELTFAELDMDCRTSPVPITGQYYEHPLHRLWYSHFGCIGPWREHDKTVTDLGALATMKIEDWAKELRELLFLDRVVHEETWT